jgi:HSP20 family protein
MIALDNLSKTFNRTWDSVSNGWNHLIQRASNALTRFHPSGDDQETSPAGSTRWGLLSADIYDDDDKVVVSIEAPGMSESDFDISVVDNVLYVKGEKHIEKEQTKGDYSVKERAYGFFERVLPLGYEVDSDTAKATYKQGVLRIEVDKSSQHKRRKIQVQ